jgi:hypothetical protein
MSSYGFRIESKSERWPIRHWHVIDQYWPVLLHDGNIWELRKSCGRSRCQLISIYHNQMHTARFHTLSSCGSNAPFMIFMMRLWRCLAYRVGWQFTKIAWQTVRNWPIVSNCDVKNVKSQCVSECLWKFCPRFVEKTGTVASRQGPTWMVRPTGDEVFLKLK